MSAPSCAESQGTAAVIAAHYDSDCILVFCRLQVLEDLVAEDDCNPDVWHLLGLAYYSGHQFEEALEAADACGLLITKLGILPDAEVVHNLAELRSGITDADVQPRLE